MEIIQTKPNIENISLIADGREHLKSRRDLNEAELNQLRAAHVSNAMEMRKISEEVRELNKQKKALNDDNFKLLDKVHQAFEDIELDAYYIDDQDESLRKYYKPDGTFIEQRRLTPSERQMHLKAINQ